MLTDEPKREQERSEIAEERPAIASTEADAPIARSCIALNADPHAMALRMESEEPIHAKESSETALPNWATDRSEMAEPSANAPLNTDKSVVTSSLRSSDRPLPSFDALRSDKFEPIARQSSSEMAEPMRAY